MALLLAAVLLPWNLYFGVGIPDSNPIVFAVLVAVTALALAALAVAGSWRRAAPGSTRPGRLGFGWRSTFPTCFWCSPSSGSTPSRRSVSAARSTCRAGWGRAPGWASPARC
ncbi:hypothetical protein I549_1364 [Mycobacterium avium subsp. avium 2285 (R)]|nr:hypothetical protein I549_1364 [Mycobacterium avium subsp. avium 2285 (R)]